MINKKEDSKSSEYWVGEPPTVASMIQNQSETLQLEERREILSQTPGLDGKQVLELGAGIGRFTSHVATTAKAVTAVDFTKQFIDENERANSEFENITYLVADVMDLNFADQSFDFVFMNWLLMYLDDPQIAQLQKSILRWTRPDARVFLRESCVTGSSGQAKRVNTPAFWGNNPAEYHATYRSKDEYTQLFANGFSLLHTGNVKIYEQLLNNPHQYYWLFRRG